MSMQSIQGGTRMRKITDILNLVEARRDMMIVLQQVAALGLPDCWIGAGFVRNAVWDTLHGFTTPTPINDVDVIYFDPSVTGEEAEQAHQADLRKTCPGIPWSVKNQAKMHLLNGDPPYRDIADAVWHWPETATAVAVRLFNGRTELLAPFGIQDLVGLVVRPTPHFRTKMGVYHSRLRQKRWTDRWSQLNVQEMPGTLATK
jgi:hypothetical protein